MTYIKKQDIIDTLEKFKKARESKRNCNKQSAIEYLMFDYVINIINTLPTHEADEL